MTAGVVGGRLVRWQTWLAVVAWIAAVACVAVIAVYDAKLRSAGRADLAQLPRTASFGVALLSAATVGLVIVVSRPGNPIGWLMSSLALSIGLAGVATNIGVYGELVRPGSSPGSRYALAYDAASFVPWLAVVSVMMLLTPTGRLPVGRWRAVLVATVCAAVSLFTLLVTQQNFPDPAYSSLRNPLSVPLPGLRPVLTLLATAGVAAGVVAAIASLLLRWRRGSAGERDQLRWVALGVVLLPVVIAVILVAALTAHPGVVSAVAGVYAAVLPVTVSLAVARSDLFDVDLVVRRLAAYVLATLAVLVTYIAVVLVIGAVLRRISYGSGISVAVATPAAAAMFLPVLRVAQDRIDRRFNRRRHEATAVMRAHVTRGPGSGESVRDTFARAVGDPAVQIAFWLTERQRLVSGDGTEIELPAMQVPVERDGELVCVIGYDPRRVDEALIVAVAREAGAELDNARLRAEINAQLVEVQDSRRRIVSAGLIERRRVERNLHDGAQQRLVALSMKLRSARLTGASDLRAVTDEAIRELQAAVRELRELANGLHPQRLEQDGLAAALEEMADRSPGVVRVSVPERRFPADVEAAIYFIACEAVANAVKHAHSSQVIVCVEDTPEALMVTISDDGGGGAHSSGQGLRGLTDRAEALGGVLQVSSPPGAGTRVEARLPCTW